jgi:hypothetical protein
MTKPLGWNTKETLEEFKKEVERRWRQYVSEEDYSEKALNEPRPKVKKGILGGIFG